jgi:hypothetical protein
VVQVNPPEDENQGSVEDENHMLFQCPVYQHVRVKYAELLESAHDFKSLFSCDTNRVGRLIHECFLVHKEPILTALALFLAFSPMRQPWLHKGR